MHGNLHAGYEAVTFYLSLFWGHRNMQTFWTWGCAMYAAPFPLCPSVLQVDFQVIPMSSYPQTSLEALLESSPLPYGIANSISNAWTVPGPRGRFSKACPDTGDPTGAKPDSGEPLLCLVTSLIVCQVPGSEAICLLGVWENANIVLVHSLFIISPDLYSADV